MKPDYERPVLGGRGMCSCLAQNLYMTQETYASTVKNPNAGKYSDALRTETPTSGASK